MKMIDMIVALFMLVLCGGGYVALSTFRLSSCDEKVSRRRRRHPRCADRCPSPHCYPMAAQPLAVMHLPSFLSLPARFCRLAQLSSLSRAHLDSNAALKAEHQQHELELRTKL